MGLVMLGMGNTEVTKIYNTCFVLSRRKYDPAETGKC